MGKKRGPGRPLTGLQRKERYQIRLEPRIADKIRRYGGGSLTGGVLLLAEKENIKLAAGPQSTLDFPWTSSGTHP